MKRTLLVTNWMLVAALLATAQKTPESMLGAALHQEEVQGDLKGAIAAYQKVLVMPGVGRKTAAEALVGMGQCYEKLGDAESRKAYERVLQEYADQKEAAAVARARLGGAEKGLRAKGDRAVWTGRLVDLFGRVSPDGRFVTFIDWNNGSLMVHDVAANVDHVLTPPAPNYSEEAGSSAFSSDGKQLVYVWDDANNRQGLRVAEFQGSRILEPRQIFLADEDVRFIDAVAWSPDGKWIAIAQRRKDGTGQIARISVDDNSFRVLKSIDWKVPFKIFFSPDSKYIAYDLPPADSQQRDVYVLAIDGSRETPAAAHPAEEAALGWSP